MEKTIVKNESIEKIESFNKRRRKMLPWWIKVFCWFFMLFGILSFICLILGFTNIKPTLSLYGFETNEPFSLIGLMIISMGLFKGVTAFGLWFEKDFGIKYGKIDAIVGIILCVFSMAILPFLQGGGTITIRLELIFLIPYLIKMNKIQTEWSLPLKEIK